MASAAEEANIRLTLGVVTSLLILSIMSLALRLYARISGAAKLWWDDYWMIFVLAICTVMSSLDYVMLAFGSGVHQKDLDPAVVLEFERTLYVYMLMWAVGVYAVKVGILLFYWRIFHTKGFRVGAIVVAAFSTGIFLSNLFSFAFQCWPIPLFWDHTLEGTCIEQTTFYFASAIINVIGDVAVLSLPLPVVWGLQTSRSKKWSLSFLFLLGAFVVIASVFRIVAVNEINPEDFTFSNVGGGLWSTVEVEVGFITANLPAIRPLVFRWLGYGTTQYGYGSDSGGAKNYGMSSKAATLRSGHRHVKLSSSHRDADLESSTEELTKNSAGESFAMSRTGTGSKPRRSDSDNLQSSGLSGDIVVTKDIGVSVSSEAAEAHGPGDSDRFVQISTPHNQIRLPGAPSRY
ncbi:hypothetical protein F4780DRAFT_483665 [Xylariomycetidae sp. FL0641]|nr:hypothetical protein F4780DRAFT_483665 [Xylariomycetidae sp. FL0641]